jgi:uncharacterized protein (DUF1697 family)
VSCCVTKDCFVAFAMRQIEYVSKNYFNVNYVAFLRGINVSGQKLIKMEELRGHFVMPGIKDVRTYIQSGNVLFDAKVTDEVKLRSKIEKQLQQQLGYAMTCVLRTVDELQQIVANCPYEIPAKDGKHKLYVTMLADKPGKDAAAVLAAFDNANEQLSIVNRDVYLLTPSYGDTKLSNNFIEKKLGIAATTRNWATINKLFTM